LHDSLFLSQSEITPENIDDHLKSFVERDPSMHAGAFWSCMKGREPEDVLARDIQLAHLYRIDGTPTIFINGRRTTGFQSLVPGAR
jgi:protein-disulfide isomerase